MTASELYRHRMLIYLATLPTPPDSGTWDDYKRYTVTYMSKQLDIPIAAAYRSKQLLEASGLVAGIRSPIQNTNGSMKIYPATDLGREMAKRWKKRREDDRALGVHL